MLKNLNKNIYETRSKNDLLFTNLLEETSNMSNNLNEEIVEFGRNHFETFFFLMEDSTNISGIAGVDISLSKSYVEITLIRTNINSAYNRECILLLLLDKIIDYTKKHKINIIKLDDIDENLISFYESCGFEIKKHTVNKRGEHHYVIILELIK